MRTATALALIALLISSLPTGCEPSSRAEGDADADGDTDSDGDTDTDSDGDTDTEDECTPGEVWCYGGWVAECNDDGVWIQTIDCAADGLICAAGECVDISTQCAEAINERSYIGCEYYATTLSNSALSAPPFTYAIAIANNGTEEAQIQIEDGTSFTYDYLVAAGEMITIEDLPWKTDIKKPSDASNVYATRKVGQAAYHITSTMPVTAYQFNALQYTMDSMSYSYTNDASLLLPAHIYRDEYVVMSRPDFKVDIGGYGSYLSQPGFLAVLGPAAGETTVEIATTAYTAASDSVSNAVYAATAPGETLTATIAPFEVLQVLTGVEPGCTGATDCYGSTCCNTPSTYDLTGTIVRVIDGPNPAVFGGHDCTFVPFNKWACDHLEEQMFPLETWGTHYLCAHNVTQAPAEPSVWRILSGSDANAIQFSPSSVHAPVTLDKGEYVEFESLADFEVVGEGRVSIAQFMVGQNYTSDTTPPLNGDPAMALGVPVEQYRTQYTFLAPTSYVYNYLTVVHLAGSFPSLDGTPITGETVDITGEWARTNLQITGGVHDIVSADPFGIEVYGVGSYTSYMYPGGLDLKEVEIIVE